MRLIIKHFDELTTKELYDILKLRTDIFVVEQKCPYPELDNKDLVAYHLWLEDEEGIEAYARTLTQGVSFEYASIGRIVVRKRRQGLGTRIVKEAIQIAKEKYNPDVIRIGAQHYAKSLYEKVGFVQVSEPFVEDGIEHILMDLRVREYEFYGYKHDDIYPVNEEWKNIGGIQNLYDRLNNIWCKESCAPRMQDNWSKENKTLGQCSITAFLAQDIYGGKVYGVPLGDGNFHCYNEVNGKVFDLTSEQFDYTFTYPMENEQKREEHFAKEEKYQRYLYLKEELKKTI